MFWTLISKEYALLEVDVNYGETLLHVVYVYFMVGRRSMLDESCACFREVL